jgi:hypothetical protein
MTMANIASVTAEDTALETDADLSEGSRWGGLVSFLAAGAVLSAGLIVGSSASMIVAGGNDLIAAILEGVLKLGLWAFGGFIAAVVLAITLTGRHRKIRLCFA